MRESNEYMRQTNDTTNTNTESNTTTSSSFDDHPIASIQGPFRLGYGYMILLFFLSLVSPTSLVYYAAVEAEDATRYFAYGQIFFPICVACNLILFVAHPREKSWQNKFTALYLMPYFAVYDVASFVGQVFTNPIISDLNTENAIQCTVDVTEEEIIEEKGEGGDRIHYKCGALLYPQIFNYLPRKVKFQLSCVAFIVVSNVTLYSMSSEGPSTVFILSLFGVSCLGIVSLAISEGVAIVKDVRKNSEAVREKVKGTNIHVHINENKTQDE
ncbi:hypothetical protein TrVE_jg3415 [Triparma verrucosa]|uniref:Uncharacterized protein n=1 Tax=Triparma verrucosa TaxID=1606542 RepID=A0A9W7F4C7_9STRA|nr:hypothetical protein TrVE_jg3415 [Triparma verrucosa]